jgi:hypothetical protein
VTDVSRRGSPSTGISGFLQALAEDLELFTAYALDRQAVLQGYEDLSEEEKALLLSGDFERVRDQLRREAEESEAMIWICIWII